MNTLDILAVGSLEKIDGIVVEANSTSTLIKSEGRNIVVDTSTPKMRPAIKTSLTQIGVMPKDVDTVILTHIHADHIGNLDMFQHADVYVGFSEHTDKKGWKHVNEDIEIAPGIRIVNTPGHTHGSISVFVEGDRKYAITGDAIPLEDNVRKMVPPGINFDSRIAIESIKSIIAYADVIIPGHGRPFMAKR